MGGGDARAELSQNLLPLLKSQLQQEEALQVFERELLQDKQLVQVSPRGEVGAEADIVFSRDLHAQMVLERETACR